MYRFCVAMVLAARAFAGEPLYELSGRLAPEEHAFVSVFGATAPFQAQTESDDDGRFRFRNLRAGTYTIAVYVPRRGEARQTAEVGPGTADAQRHVNLTLEFKDSDFVYNDVVRRRNSVSTRQLTIPDAAHRDYQDAARDLEKHDVESAVKYLEHAVELAPQFADAWNNLGTIAYQSQQYERAEKCFRTALDGDPKAYEPLVNLGGVLINNHKLDEALTYNRTAVLIRPNDALANSQLGLTYFVTGDYDAATKYLEVARHIDPSHFSHPQLVLAEIHVRRGEKTAAAEVLDDFLRRHPDYSGADQLRVTVAKLRRDGAAGH